MDVLQRDYLPFHLLNEIYPHRIDGTVAVQARQSLEETRWLLQLADSHPFITGIVGWVPLVEPNINDTLHEFAVNPYLKGVRHELQNEPDKGYMLRDDFNYGIQCLLDYKLVYDILIFSGHLPNSITFVDRHPNQVFVIDHIAKPVISSKEFDHEWMKNIREIAKRENVYCKVSGVVTEVHHPQWTYELIQPYLDMVLEVFGANRLMFGTDWPVCKLCTDYKEWVNTVQKWLSPLSKDEQDDIMGKTACTIYGLYSQ